MLVAGRPGFDEGCDDVLVERLAEGTGLLGAVERGDPAGRRRQGVDERGCVERPEQPDLDHPHLLAARHQRLDRLLEGAGSRADHDGHSLGVRAPK